MKFSNRTRAATALVACAAIGAAGGIAGSAAAPSTSKTKSAAKTATAKNHAGHPGGGPGGPGGRAVHSEDVVLNKAGDAFITQTEDHGTIKSISGSDVTIAEAIGSVSYKDVTITIPAAATIERDGKTAAIGDLAVGDHIGVSQSSDGVDVHAGDASFKPAGGPGHGPGPGPGGPPPAQAGTRHP
ncbi:MAG TPA: hypothetical protein VGF63_15180 [Solirubrobacteraceae bacterium]|jgi:hypothetical protein